MISFSSTLNATPTPGMVLRLATPETTYLRVTHVFPGCLYVMWVGEPSEIRTARRPVRKSWAELEKLIAAHAGEWGQMALPPIMTIFPEPQSEQGRKLSVAWSLISPLVEAFEIESNLSRTRFKPLASARAKETKTDTSVLIRLLLRFYFFGRTKLGLLNLPRGTKPGRGGYAGDVLSDEVTTPKKRRGRQPVLAQVLGKNDFVASDADKEDMVSTYTSLLRSGPTQKSHAHERYLAGPFRKRNPEIHAAYIAGTRVEPVTARQYSYYVDRFTVLSEELAENVRTHRRNPGRLGSIGSAGPGEVYEIDSTGGRLFLVTSDDPPIHLGKPTIYLLIDRWSRFVVSAYLSLKPPSYEEVRHALLVAFTSRARRFSALGVDTDDQRWPVGQMPAVICPDRGAEFMSESMEQSVVQDLRVELTPLPPYCPDGKAIVERLIREVKRRMSASDLKGTYGDRPMDPDTKRAARRAKEAAVHSLADAYRLLIEIISDHNNRPHSALRRRRILTQASVKPTPRTAYLWGLENITGLRKAPFTDDDYKRMLLATAKANLGSGVLRYRQRPYLPTNEIAVEMTVRSTNRAKQVDVRVDKTDPGEVFVVDAQGRWAAFGITRGGASEIAGLTLDEEDLLSPQTALLWAKSEHNSRVERVASMSAKAKPNGRKNAAVQVAPDEQGVLRTAETDVMKLGLAGKKPKDITAATDSSPNGADDWSNQEAEERRRMLALTRKQRGRK